MGRERTRRCGALRENLIILKHNAKIDMIKLHKIICISYPTVLNIFQGKTVSEKTLDKLEPHIERLITEQKLPFNSCVGQVKSGGGIR